MLTVTIKITLPIPETLARIAIWLILFYRKHRYGFAFRKIMLTQGKFAIVDPIDYYKLIKYRWYAVDNGRTFYAVTSKRVNGRTVSKQMHRLIMEKELNSDPRRQTSDPGMKYKNMLVIDHINHDGLDNRKANLRVVTVQQNSWNSRLGYKSGSSVYKGVCWRKKEKKWVARIRKDGKYLNLGSYDDEKEAGLAYDAAALKYRGKHAFLNFPELVRPQMDAD